MKLISTVTKSLCYEIVENQFLSKQVFERDDNGHAISCAISRKLNITYSSPRRADTWFPYLSPPPTPPPIHHKEC